MVDTSLKSKTTKGVFWSAIERFSVQGVQFLLTIIIARLITPSDYGLIAMLNIFLAIAQVFIDSGFSNALIQKRKRSAKDFSTVFYFNIVIGFCVYCFLFISSPYIALFYDEPQLDLVAKVIGLNLIINSFSVVQRAKLTIDLDFRRQAIASLNAVVISGGIGVYLAYKGYGVWSIVVQSLFNSLLNTILLWVITKWKPRARFSKESFNELFSFGSKLLLSGLLHTVYVNLYNIIIGKKFSSSYLGYYNRAYTIAYFPSSNFSNVIARAIYPIQCSIQNDIELLRQVFLQHIRMSVYVIFPLMIGLCVLAEPLVKIVLTDKWLPSVPLIQILCIAYIWEPVMLINCNLLNVRGRSDYYLKSEIIKKIVAVLILLLTFPFGIKVICSGLILYAVSDVFIVGLYVRKVIHCSIIEQLKSIFPVLALNISMGIAIYLIVLPIHSPAYKVLVGTFFGLLYYLSISYFFKMKEFVAICLFVTRRDS